MKNPKLKTGKVLNQTAEPQEQYERGIAGYTDFEKNLREESVKKQGRYVALGFEQKRNFTKIPDQVAESDHWMKNEPIPYGLDLFPHDLWFMRFSDLFYPHAKGGPLYIDTPGSPTEYAYCEKKLKAYQDKGVRYTFIKPNEDASDVAVRLDPMLPIGIQVMEKAIQA